MTPNPGPDTEPQTYFCDVAVVGGGVAGLWVLNLLASRGYKVLLCEAQALGNAQSIASQGMIHGGIKYALGAALTGASEAISRMPDRWRRCLAGTGEIDLQAVEVVARSYHMWSDGKLGKLGSFLASKALRGRVDALTRTEFPKIFQDPEFTGTVHELSDLVLDVNSLIHTLASPHQPSLLAGRVTQTLFDANGNVQSLELDNGRSLQAQQVIFCAGAGNSRFSEDLKAAGHSHAPATQLRPLHQVFVRHPDLQELYAHCLTGIRSAEPRLTITTHALNTQDAKDKQIGWYIGGHLATTGVKRTREAQIEVARRELALTLPWIDWRQAEIDTLRIDRAEPRQHLGTKPDEACVVSCGNAMLCWPTKLSLVPDLGDQVLNAINPATPAANQNPASLNGPPSPVAQPPVAQPPWFRDGRSGEQRFDQ